MCKWKNTFKFKIVMLLAGMVLCFLVLGIAQNIYVNSLRTNYEKIDDLTERYNDILKGVEAVNSELQEYTYGNGEQIEIRQSMDKLCEDAQIFSEVVNEIKYDRKAIDLNNLVLSYISSAQRRMDFFDAQKYEECIKEASDFNEIKGFVINQFAETDSSLRTYISDILMDNEAYLTNFRIALAFVTVIVLALFLFLAISLWKRFLNPVSQLSHATEYYKLGEKFEELCYNVEFDRKDEIGILACDIREMIEEVEQTFRLEQQNVELHMNVIQSERLAKEAELKFLQSRINPHFLFNSFNMIAETAYLEDAAQTYELLEALGVFLRYNLDNFNKIVTVQQEVENLESYLVLQRMRMGNRIDFRIKCDGKIDTVQMPCLILQPLVENAIIHGVGNFKADGKVLVEIYKKDDKIEVRVKDNGKGMSKAELEHIRQVIDTASDSEENERIESNHIGLKNVFGRLQLFYKKDTCAGVDSKPYDETVFYFTIPIQ